MQRKKKMSDVTEPTQPQRDKRFVRQSSFCSSTCKSNSSRKSLEKNENIEVLNLNTDIPINLPLKNHTVSMKFCKNPEDRMTPPLKSSTGSMKFDFLCGSGPSQESCKQSSSEKCPEDQSQDLSALKAENKKLKVYLNQQRSKRKLLEEEVILTKQQLKRLEKRLEKYSQQIESLKEERKFMLAHIEELEKTSFTKEHQQIHSYCLKVAQEEIVNLRNQLQKKKTEREKELLEQIEGLIEQNYTLKKEANAATIAKDAISKQLEQADMELDEMRYALRQKTTNSTEYIELRQRYKILLVESKWLKEQIEHLQNLRGEKSSLVQGTLLTISTDSVQLDQ